jgi:hypothetical protein
MYYQEVQAPPQLLPIGNVFTWPVFQLWVCGACGFTMWFVPQEQLGKVKKKFFRHFPAT